MIKKIIIWYYLLFKRSDIYKVNNIDNDNINIFDKFDFLLKFKNNLYVYHNSALYLGKNFFMKKAEETKRSVMYEIVKNMNILKAMERQGFITLHEQTGTRITGLYSKRKFTCYYIDEGNHTFEYKGDIYHTKYIDGCFCPYVFKEIKWHNLNNN